MKMINLKYTLAVTTLALASIVTLPVTALASCPSNLATMGITQVNDSKGDFILPMMKDGFFKSCGAKDGVCYETDGNAPSNNERIYISLPGANAADALTALNQSAIFTATLKPGGYNAGDCFARIPAPNGGGYVYLQVGP